MACTVFTHHKISWLQLLGPEQLHTVMLLLHPEMSEAQFAGGMQEGTANCWCLSGADHPINCGRWKILAVWLPHLTTVPPGAAETFCWAPQTQPLPRGFMRSTGMSHAAAYMKTLLVDFAFVKGVNSKLSVFRYLSLFLWSRNHCTPF